MAEGLLKGDETVVKTLVKEDTRTLYLDLMKHCLTNFIYGDAEVFPLALRKTGMMRRVGRFFRALGLEVGKPQPFNPEARRLGGDFPPTAHTMIGLERLENLEFCVKDVLEKGVPGDFIETGVWRGGASIFVRAILKAYQVTDRGVWVADSFEGLPVPNAEKYPADAKRKYWKRTRLAISLEEVRSHFESYGLLDDQVRFLKGWFKDTLPTAPIEKLAVIRLDGDMYESTMDGLNNLYSKLSRGGYLIVDDFGAVTGCKKAVEDFRAEHGITDEIHQIDWAGSYWQRS